MEIMLSVVVFVYNHEKYICKCLDSILNQKTDFKFEIVVADDCSTDNTFSLLKKEYGDKITVIRRKENMGMCRNMYHAFKEVQGKYIFTCDGDDYLIANDLLQKHVDFLEKNKDYFSVTNWIVFRNTATGEEKIREIPYTEYTMLDYLRGVKVDFFLGTIRNTFKYDKADYFCFASKNNEESQTLYYSLNKGKKAVLPEAMYAYCYRVDADSNNYCSKHSNLQMLSDYAEGFYAIEKYDADADKYNFGIAKLRRYEVYIDKILETKDLREIIQIAKVLKWSDIWSFIGYKLILRLNHYKMPAFLLREQRLVKRK